MCEHESFGSDIRFVGSASCFRFASIWRIGSESKTVTHKLQAMPLTIRFARMKKKKYDNNTDDDDERRRWRKKRCSNDKSVDWFERLFHLVGDSFWGRYWFNFYLCVLSLFRRVFILCNVLCWDSQISNAGFFLSLFYDASPSFGPFFRLLSLEWVCVNLLAFIWPLNRRRQYKKHV